MTKRQCDLCKRAMLTAPPGAIWPELSELSFTLGEHKCVCQGCFLRSPGMQEAAALLAEQMRAGHAQWVFKPWIGRKEVQMSDEHDQNRADEKTEPPYESPFAPGKALDPARGLGVELALRQAKAQLDADYPTIGGEQAYVRQRFDARAKAMVHTKIDEALLWLGKVGAMFALVLMCGCGGLAIVRDKLASYGDELAVFCPQTNISQDCIDARRRYEVGTAAVQTATLGEQIGKDAQNLITQADTVVGAALEYFKKTFLSGAK
jgi:hypothetical protein